MHKSIMLLIFAFTLAMTACSEVQIEEVGEETSLERGFCSAVSEIPTSECEALVSFYNSTNGPNWALKRGWLETKHPCDWSGVECGAGHVRAIMMNYNELSDSLPPEIGHLSRLATLTLYFNHLRGPIPAELGHLSNLRVLILHNNQLSGNIPAELGNLTNLRMFDANSNNLRGNLPDNIQNLPGSGYGFLKWGKDQPSAKDSE